MNERIKNVMKCMENWQMELDDTLPFSCTHCGGCCVHQEELLLNPLDLFRMAVYLGITVEQWLDRYGECYIGEDSRMPILRIRPRGQARRCPLQKNNKCSVHKAKPSVCGLYPLGRSVRYAMDKQGKPDLEKSEVIYFHGGCFCGSRDGHQTVREWLEEFHLLQSESFFLQWSYVIMETSQFLRRLEKVVTNKDIMMMVWNMVFGLLYARYDTGKEFQSQFEQNVKQLKEHIADIERLGVPDHGGRV